MEWKSCSSMGVGRKEEEQLCRKPRPSFRSQPPSRDQPSGDVSLLPPEVNPPPDLSVGRSLSCFENIVKKKNEGVSIKRSRTTNSSI